MAGGTIHPELAPMNVGVTIGASYADMGELQRRVTARAFDLAMNPHQRETGFIMVEFKRLF